MTKTETLDDFWNERAQDPDEARANGWSEHSQIVRFCRALWHIDGSMEMLGGTMLDYGCGTGRLADFTPRSIDYLGMEPNRAMFARAVLERPDAAFDTVVKPGESFDYVMALGVWNVKPWNQEWTRNEITRLWSLTKNTLVVSLLRRADNDDRSLVYSPHHVASWAGLLSKNWIIDCGYLGNDFMLVMQRVGLDTLRD